MSDLLFLDVAKEHLRVTGMAEDEQITALIAVATSLLEDFLNRPLIGDEPPAWSTAAAVPANVVHALKLILTSLYDDRERPLEDMTAIRSLVGRYQIVGFA